MKIHTPLEYKDLLCLTPDNKIDRLCCLDHLGGIESDFSNAILDKVSLLSQTQQQPIEFYSSYLFEDPVQLRYPNLNFKYYFYTPLRDFESHNQHQPLSFKNFICCFNGSPHVGRKLLVALLNQFGWFHADYCSKNFVYDPSILDGHISDFLTPEQHRLYRKFFIDSNDLDFPNRLHTFGHYQRRHDKNIFHLEDTLTKSFLHLVSETMATSYHPFVTEKFFYSVVTRGLFLAYAQPGWHDHVERYFGFRKYDKIFDYRFDSIKNPVERLIELASMISKFSRLSSDDWHDLYEMQSDTIEYNYDNYFSGRYLAKVKQDVV